MEYSNSSDDSSARRGTKRKHEEDDSSGSEDEGVSLSKQESEETPENVLVKKLSRFAITPRKDRPSSAGFNLYAYDQVYIQAKSTGMIDTKIALDIPKGYYGRIVSSNRLAVYHNIITLAGVIDPDYRGEIKVLAHNLSNHPVRIHSGTKIARIIFQKIHDATHMTQVNRL